MGRRAGPTSGSQPITNGATRPAGDGKPPADPPLVALAQERFPDLKKSELKVIHDACHGACTTFGDDDPACGGAWPGKRTVRAEILRWLLADPAPRAQLNARGVNVVGARIKGALILKGAEVGVRAGLHRCALDMVLLEDARLRTFSLRGSHCAGLSAQRVQVAGALFLDGGFTARGMIDLTSAVIKGPLACSDAQLTGGGEAEQQKAMVLINAKIEGRACLDGRFHARGRVDMTGVSIDGSLHCAGARFECDDGPALDLQDAVIGHGLECSGSSLRARVGDALDARRVTIAGNAIFGGNDAELAGPIELSQASIGGMLRVEDVDAPLLKLYRAHIHADLEIERVNFQATARSGLIANDAHVDGELKWRNVTTAMGTQLDLRGAEVATLDDQPHDWLDSPGFWPRYEGLKYQRIEHASKDVEIEARISWLKHQPRLAEASADDLKFRPQPYNQLASYLRTAGHERLAHKVAMAREADRRTRGGLSVLGLAWSWLLRGVIGSGYKPHWALGWSIVIVAIGTAVFGLAQNADHLGDITNGSRPGFNEFVYSLDTFLPVTDLQQERFRAPEKGFARFYHWPHVVLGWILVTLGILGLTGLVKRE